MSQKEPDVQGKMYHPIGEVSRMLGVPVPTIRYWEKEFDVIRPKKNRKGDRYFTPQDVNVLKLVHHMVKERGMTIVTVLTGADDARNIAFYENAGFQRRNMIMKYLKQK